MASGGAPVQVYTESQLNALRVADLKLYLNELGLRASSSKATKAEIINMIMQFYRSNNLGVYNVPAQSTAVGNNSRSISQSTVPVTSISSSSSNPQSTVPATLTSSGNGRANVNSSAPVTVTNSNQSNGDLLVNAINRLELDITRLGLRLEISRLQAELDMTQFSVPNLNSTPALTNQSFTETQPNMVNNNNAVNANNNSPVNIDTTAIGNHVGVNPQADDVMPLGFEGQPGLGGRVGLGGQPGHRDGDTRSDSRDEVSHMFRLMSDSLSLSKLPTPEPPVFDGDSFMYPEWNQAFKSLIEQRAVSNDDRMFYLKKYVKGPALSAIRGYVSGSSSNAYVEAKAVLDRRYGSSYRIAEAYRKRLEDWPKISNKDGQSLQELADFLVQCRASMNVLPELGFLNDHLLNQKLLQLLPDYLIRRWNQKVVDHEEKHNAFPDFTHFVDFMEREAQMACHPVTSLGVVRKKTSTSVGKPASLSHAVKNDSGGVKNTKCAFCSGDHQIWSCSKFKDLGSDEKLKFVKGKKACFNCLRFGHSSRFCTWSRRCEVCSNRHHSLLHKSFESSKGVDKVKANCGSVHHSTSGCLCSMVVPVWVSTRSNPSKRWLTYAMLDTQSDTTFLSDEVASKIDGHSVEAMLSLSTMTSKGVRIKCTKFTDLTVQGFHSDEVIELPGSYTRDLIPHNPSHIPTARIARSWSHLQSISDCIEPSMRCRVGMLIGYNCPQALAPLEVLRGNQTEPFAIRTVLGWSIVGQLVSDSPEVVDSIGVSHRVTCFEVLEDLQVQSDSHSNSTLLCNRTQCKELPADPSEVVRLLEGDFISVGSGAVEMSQEDLRFLKVLGDNIFQDSDGFYTMPLPFKRDESAMPNNRSLAFSRFKHLTNRFSRDPEFLDLYTSFMDGIISKGEAELVPESELRGEDGSVWYLPHHGVFHPRTHKFRVVFDGSARFKGSSLNDCLIGGPNLNNCLVGVLTRFRQESVAISCDIKKMFHQFRVIPSHRNFLRFFWFGQSQSVCEYRMTVHLFGAASSPGCAKFGLHRIVDDYCSSDSNVFSFVKDNFYVDDGLTSCSTVAEAVQLLKETQSVLSKGNLTLHKFSANNLEVLNHFPKSEWSPDLHNVCSFSSDDVVETALGLRWSLASDEFLFFCNPKDISLTRRGLLSTLASVFDPLGLVSPVLLAGKLILQRSSSEVDWDDPLPESMASGWRAWLAELASLSSLKVNRCLKPSGFGDVISAEIHTFADASEVGYGSCCYLRLTDASGTIHCSLLFAKSRVVPSSRKKRVSLTIPRLELQAALLAAKIGTKMANELHFDTKQFYYSDSQIALAYIANTTKRFHIYVANRVAQILELTSVEQWLHVAGLCNPADHASRGLSSSSLMSSRWFLGPAFLWCSSVSGSVSSISHFKVEDDDREVKSTSLLTVGKDSSLVLDHVGRFSRWTSAIRFAAILFFAARYRWVVGRFSLDVDRLRASELWLLKFYQSSAFEKEFELLKSGRAVDRSSSIWRLDPYIDKDGLLRVGGRMRFSSLLEEEKHPLILPKSGHITILIIRHYHILSKHQGRGMTIAAIRSAGFWIVNITGLVSSLIFHCVTCRSMRRPLETQKMSDLPAERVTTAPPFSYVGCDCFGPFTVKDGRKYVKKYGLIFVCLPSRAVHVELLDDMSSDCFINSLRCFIALRGPVRLIRCDQGTNFVGASSEFLKAGKELDSVKSFLLKENCDFQFNVPCASHMGGSWERLIRVFRNVLNGILKMTDRLDISSARTVMYEAMAIVNSRPLTTMEGSLEPLTPNHLLHMKAGVVLPPPGVFDSSDIYCRKRWRRVQVLVDLFWKRWKSGYLAGLQQRSKWLHSKRNLKIGDVVLIHEESVRTEWRLGLVVGVLPSADGQVRKVRVRVGRSDLTSKVSFLDRPVHKLVVLIEA